MGNVKRILFTVMSLLFILVGCESDSSAGSDSEKLQIITTLFPQYDFARVIAGDKADATLLLPPGMEAHSYEPTPADMIKINKADLFIYTGESMEQWAHTMIESIDSDSVYVLDVSKNVPLLEPNQTTEESDDHDHEEDDHDHEHESHDHEEDHAEEDGHYHAYDPHIWTSPKNAMIMVNNILEALCEIDPDNATYYEDNAKLYLAELEELDNEFKDVVENAKRETIYHAGRFAMQYLTNEYGIHYVSAPFEAEPSAALVAQMIKEIKEQGIPAIYHEELVDPKIAQMISDETGAQMLLLHSCHNVSKEDFNQGVTYLSLMKQNVENLRMGLN